MLSLSFPQLLKTTLIFSRREISHVAVRVCFPHNAFVGSQRSLAIMHKPMQSAAVRLPAGVSAKVSSDAELRIKIYKVLESRRPESLDVKELMVSMRLFEKPTMKSIILAHNVLGKLEMYFRPEFVSTLLGKLRGRQLIGQNMSMEDISRCMPHMRYVSAEIKEVREYVKFMADQIALNVSVSPNAACELSPLVGVRNMRCDSEELIAFVNSTTAYLTKNPSSHAAMSQWTIALYGLHSMTDEEKCVRSLLGTLTEVISDSTEPLDSEGMSKAINGLKAMGGSRSGEFLKLLQTITRKIAESKKVLHQVDIGVLMEGLHNMKADCTEIRDLLYVLSCKLSESTQLFTSNTISSALFGIQNFSNDALEVEELLLALAWRIGKSRVQLSGQEIGRAIYGLKCMNDRSEGLQSLMRVLIVLLEDSKLARMSGKSMEMALFGLQGLSSEPKIVRNFIDSLRVRLSGSKSMKLTGEILSNSMFGLQNLSNECEEVKNLIKDLTFKMKRNQKLKLSEAQVAKGLYGLQKMKLDIHMKDFLKTFARIVLPKDGKYTLEHKKMVKHGLKIMDNTAPETQYLINFIIKSRQSSS
jgi:hypothetical protein